MKKIFTYLAISFLALVHISTTCSTFQEKILQKVLSKHDFISYQREQNEIQRNLTLIEQIQPLENGINITKKDLDQLNHEIVQSRLLLIKILLEESSTKTRKTAMQMRPLHNLCYSLAQQHARLWNVDATRKLRENEPLLYSQFRAIEHDLFRKSIITLRRIETLKQFFQPIKTTSNNSIIIPEI